MDFEEELKREIIVEEGENTVAVQLEPEKEKDSKNAEDSFQKEPEKKETVSRNTEDSFENEEEEVRRWKGSRKEIRNFLATLALVRHPLDMLWRGIQKCT